MERLTNSTIQILSKQMNLPQEFINVSLDKIPVSVKPIILKYLDEIETNMQESAGFILHGKRGVGKTSCAIYIAKRIKMTLNPLTNKFYSAFFIKCGDFKESFKTKEMIEDTDLSVSDKCKEVDFLILDDLTVEDLNENWPGAKVFIDLLKHRTTNCKPTFITTNINSDNLVKASSQFFEAMVGYNVPLAVVGEDQKLAKHQVLIKRMLNK